MNNTLLSVVIACYNEKEYISACLDSILNQKFTAGEFEIIVVDGMSTDGTRDILSLYRNSGKIKILDNKKRYTPFAFNIGIKEAKGKYITILGAHAVYDETFLQNSIKLFDLHPEISCAGGPIMHYGRNSFARAAALAMSHPIGVGNAKHRFSSYEGYAEGAGFPTFRREVFEEVGLYDEQFKRNQDDELNYRLTKSGGKVYISPLVKSAYYVKDSVKRLFRQYFEYGYWRSLVIKKHKTPVSFRQVIPFLFFAIIFLLLLLYPFVPELFQIIFISIPLLYMLTVLLTGLNITIRKNFSIGANFILAVFTLHIAYALGFARGLLKLWQI